MPKLGKSGELSRLESLLDPDRRYVDLAVRLRLLNDDGSSGPLLRGVVGGRWDTYRLRWVTPRPKDLRVVEWTVQRQQMQLLKVAPAVMFLAIFAGRQAGKTQGAVQTEIAQKAIASPGRDFAVVSLNFKSSRDPEKAFRRLLAPHWRVKHNKTDRTYTFPHGARVVFRSEEAIDSVRGPSLKGVLLDEAAYMHEEAFTTAVGCGVASRDFRLSLATTPKRESAWIRRVNDDWSRRDACSIVRLRSEENPYRKQELLDELRATMPPDLYAQEFEGRIVAPPDAVYYLFDRTHHLRPLPQTGDVTRAFTQREFGKPTDYVAGWDFGFEAVTIGKVFRSGSTELLWIVGEAVADRTTTDHHAHLVAGRWGQSITIITDSMGAHENARPGVTTAAIRLLKEVFPPGVATVRQVATRNPDVGQTIRAVLRMLASARGGRLTDPERRLFVVPGACPKLVLALEGQRMGPTGRPVPDDHAHVLDALRYLVTGTFPIRGEMPDGYERPFAREGT